MNDDGGGGIWATGSAVVAAVLASACCILPLVLGGLGISAVAVAGFFESIRLYLLVVTALLLGAGFYFSYFRKQECAPGGDCELPRPRLRRFNRSMLWLGTIAVMALAFFPSYAAIFVGDEIPPRSTLREIASETVVLSVQGMTCESCATAIQRQLAQVPGVLRAAVSFDTSKAVVEVDANARPATEVLTDAVERAGYAAFIKDDG